ncbi:hypothetical protein HAX54_021071, partial [Datura stramonium]|nr:hypothetical protein [Datura stramonium]
FLLTGLIFVDVDTSVALVSHWSSPTKCRLNRRSRVRASGHFLDPRFTFISWVETGKMLCKENRSITAEDRFEPVREFYASYRARQDMLKNKGGVDKMTCLASVLIRGQEVPITPEEINSVYWAYPVRPIQDFKRKLDDKDDQF